LKILIVKIGAIGDVIMALPLVSEIKKKHPEAKITWVCGKVVYDLLINFKDIDELIVVNENELLNEGFPGKIKAFFTVWKALFLRKFDLCLYFYFSDLYKILILPASCKETRRFKKNGAERLNPIPGRHHTTDYISTFFQSEGPFSFNPEYPQYSYPFTPVNPVKASFPGKKWVVLSCGGAKNILRDDDLRRWPIESYQKLGQMIVEAGHQLILSGAKSDLWVEKHFEEIPHQSLIGKLGLNDFISLLKESDLLITHDSGPLHIADLANCPVVGLFGPTIPHEKLSLQEKSDFIWGGEKLSCRPCYDGKTYATCSDNQCMKLISARQVFERVEFILKGNKF